MPVLPLTFQFGYRLFLFLVWLLWKRLPILYWIKMIKCENPCFLVPEFSRKALAFHFGVLCCLWVCHKSLLLCCEMLPLYLGKRYFGKSFFFFFLNPESVLNFIKYFSYICWDGHVVFAFSFVHVVYHTDWFAYVEPSLWPWHESTWVRRDDLFYVLLDSVC